MEALSKPIVIEDEEVCLYGIFRGVKDPKTVIVFIPALTGTRIGPQRMFVEIANHLNKENIGSICFDFPYAGDSIDKTHTNPLYLRDYYNFHLSKVCDFLLQEYPRSEIIFISISIGCMPILEFSEKNKLNKVILLSPNHLSKNKTIVNKHNIYAYFIKLFQFNTWRKLFFLKLNFGRIVSNVFYIKSKEKKNRNEENNHLITCGKVDLLCIFGENDPELMENQKFWKHNNIQGRFNNYDEYIVPNSDHSYMGWNSKEELLTKISNWLN